MATGSDRNDDEAMTPLMWAAHEGHINTVRSLLDMPGIDINAKIASGYTALGYACFRGQLEVAKVLVAAGARVTAQGSNEWGALLSAAWGGRLQVVKYLVEEAGADVRCADPGGKTPFMVAAAEGYVDVVDYLRDRPGIDINTKADDGCTALAYACGSGHLKVAKLLVKAGANVDPQGSDEWGALALAASGGHLQVVKYLVEEARADVRWADPDGKTPHMVAVCRGQAEVAEYLRQVLSRLEYEVSVARLV
jgi:ankyrin repeat protein